MGPGGQRFLKEEKIREQLKEPKPKSIREVPGYLYRVVSKFLYRLLYIYGIVWDTKPWILFFMVFIAIWNGVTPVVTSIIGKEILNSLGAAYTSAVSGAEMDFDRIMMLLIMPPVAASVAVRKLTMVKTPSCIKISFIISLFAEKARVF